MYREHRIRSFKELKDFILALDEDEGIRIFGKVKGFTKGGFIFIGIYMGKYCVMICDRIWNQKSKSYLVGSKSKYFYFSEIKELLTFLEINIEKPLKAWLY
ncbi:MAG: hypothetical protein O2U61_01515 [Candidatus Bathyarchaeota archaeon]|nr:hypothetical protein [Candidatus Bathyarchaeota archaeon]MCZ2845167.1 hypothetical protein [Candidatus Bathyarchaeota archaeon]